jgi:enoyl-CoA hydratase
VIHSEKFSPEEAVTAGFLDRIVPQPELLETARAKTSELAALPRAAYAATKQRARAEALQRIHAAIENDERDLRG